LEANAAGADEAVMLNDQGRIAEGTADKCFLTGTGAELIPVKEVSSRQITSVRGPIFRQLHEAFCGSTRGARLAMC